jgi:hypothetical protein
MITIVFFLSNASGLVCAKNLRKWAEKAFASSTLVFHEQSHRGLSLLVNWAISCINCPPHYQLYESKEHFVHLATLRPTSAAESSPAGRCRCRRRRRQSLCATLQKRLFARGEGEEKEAGVFSRRQ